MGNYSCQKVDISYDSKQNYPVQSVVKTLLKQGNFKCLTKKNQKVIKTLLAIHFKVSPLF